MSFWIFCAVLPEWLLKVHSTYAEEHYEGNISLGWTPNFFFVSRKKLSKCSQIIFRRFVRSILRVLQKFLREIYVFRNLYVQKCVRTLSKDSSVSLLICSARVVRSAIHVNKAKFVENEIFADNCFF